MRKRTLLTGAVAVIVLAATAHSADAAAGRRGTLDDSFGSSGITRTSFGTNVLPSHVWSGRDGSILVANVVTHGRLGSSDSIALSRYSRNGVLDRGFGKAGKVFLGVTYDGYSATVAPAPGGKTVVIDSAPPGNSPPYRYGIRIRRLLRNGAMDKTFGDAGTVIDQPFILANAPQGPDGWQAAAVRDDGKIVVAVSAGAGLAYFGPAAFAGLLVQYNEDGTPDLGFGVGARAPLPPITVPGGGVQVAKIIPLAGGGMLLGGQLSRPDQEFDLWVARFSANGTPDPTFGTAGVTIVDFGGWDWFQDMELSASGTVLVLAWTFGPFVSLAGDNGSSHQGIVRLTTSGKPDSTFGTDGLLRMRDRSETLQATDLSSGPQGNFYLSYAGVCSADLLLCSGGGVGSFNKDGTPDTRFAATGYAALPADDGVWAVACSKNGVLAALSVLDETGQRLELGVARLVS